MFPSLASNNHRYCVQADTVLCSEIGVAYSASSISSAHLDHLCVGKPGGPVLLTALDAFGMQPQSIAITSGEAFGMKARWALVPTWIALRVLSCARALACWAASFRPHIKAVLGASSQEQVVGTDAAAITGIAGRPFHVTGVADEQAVGNGAVVERPREDVRSDVLLPDADRAIAIAGPGHPQPAIAGLIDIRPELLDRVGAHAAMREATTDLRAVAAAVHIRWMAIWDRLAAPFAEGRWSRLRVHAEPPFQDAVPQAVPAALGLSRVYFTLAHSYGYRGCYHSVGRRGP